VETCFARALRSAMKRTTTQVTIVSMILLVNHSNGHLKLRTAEGDLVVDFPPAALANIKQRDRLTVEVAISPGQ
jgi:hypothetical protein